MVWFVLQIGRVRAERLAAEMESLTNEQENLDAGNLAYVADALEQIVQFTNKDDQVKYNENLKPLQSYLVLILKKKISFFMK